VEAAKKWRVRSPLEKLGRKGGERAVEIRHSTGSRKKVGIWGGCDAKGFFKRLSLNIRFVLGGKKAETWSWKRTQIAKNERNRENQGGHGRIRDLPLLLGDDA